MTVLRPAIQWVRRSGFRPTPGLLVLLLLATVWFVALRPTYLGGSTAYVIVSGQSMEPTLRTGDLVAVRAHPSYRPGDIVAYRVPEGDPGEGAVVIHRIVGGSGPAGYLLKGDNTQGPDLWRPGPPDVIGRTWIRLPGAGRVLAPLLSPLWLALLAGMLAAWSVLGWEDRPAARAPLLHTRPRVPELATHLRHRRDHRGGRHRSRRSPLDPRPASRFRHRRAHRGGALETPRGPRSILSSRPWIAGSPRHRRTRRGCLRKLAQTTSRSRRPAGRHRRPRPRS